MYRYCSKCGCKCLENTKFCTRCGVELVQYSASTTPEAVNNYNDFEQQVSDTYEQPQPQQAVAPQHYPQQQDYCNQRKPSKLKPILAVIGTIAIVGMVIAILLFVPFNSNNTTPNIGYTTVGPKVSLQSLANGNTLVIPEVGFTGVYGYYTEGNKIGEISFTSEGYKIYNDEQCIKVVGDGYFDFSSTSQEASVNYGYNAYVANDDYNLKYLNMVLTYEFPEGLDFDMDLDTDVTMEFDEDKGEITSSYTANGADNSIVMKMSDEYWELSDMFTNLYVGYKNEFLYTIQIPPSSIETMEYSSEVTIKFEVTGQEDVTVPAGKFKDCYIVEYRQEYYGSFSTSSTVWVNENGIVPKMELAGSTSMTGTDTQSGTMVLQLESYSKA